VQHLNPLLPFLHPTMLLFTALTLLTFTERACARVVSSKAHSSQASTSTHRPINVPLKASSVDLLGPVSDRASNPGIHHDGGGGVTQGGYHIQMFADSQTNTPEFSFVHNSLAYSGYVRSPC
jgi:hypothetical protein